MIGVADVAGNQATELLGDLDREPQRFAIERLEQVLLADQTHLLSVAVVGEGEDDVGSGVSEFAMQALDGFGVVENDLGNEGPGLYVAAPFQLEEIAFGADHAFGVQPVLQAPR